jgi:anti-anti-sigma regulatory factor
VLRIQRDVLNANEVTLFLQGRIISDWIVVLERECEELSRSGFRVVLDFSGVVFIDRAGFAALAQLSRSGVEIVGCSPLVAAMLEQEGIAAKQASKDAEYR